MTPSKTTDQVRDEVLDFVRKSEETITDASRRWLETLRELVPGDGEGIRRVIDDTFEFTERVLKNQRELAGSVLDALVGEPSTKRPPAAKRAPATKRAAAPKRTASAKTRRPARSARAT